MEVMKTMSSELSASALSVDSTDFASTVTDSTVSTPLLSTAQDRPVTAVKTTWTVNPFGELPDTGSAVSRIMEYTVTDSTSGGAMSVAPNRTAMTSAGASMPVHFWIAVEAGEG